MGREEKKHTKREWRAWRGTHMCTDSWLLTYVPIVCNRERSALVLSTFGFRIGKDLWGYQIVLFPFISVPLFLTWVYGWWKGITCVRKCDNDTMVICSLWMPLSFYIWSEFWFIDHHAAKDGMWKEEPLQQTGLGKLDIHMQKNEIWSLLHTICKNQLKTD